MKCRNCNVEIPGPNGSSFYGQIGVTGVKCKPCYLDEIESNIYSGPTIDDMIAGEELQNISECN